MHHLHERCIVGWFVYITVFTVLSVLWRNRLAVICDRLPWTWALRFTLPNKLFDFYHLVLDQVKLRTARKCTSLESFHFLQLWIDLFIHADLFHLLMTLLGEGSLVKCRRASQRLVHSNRARFHHLVLLFAGRRIPIRHPIEALSSADPVDHSELFKGQDVRTSRLHLATFVLYQPACFSSGHHGEVALDFRGAAVVSRYGTIYVLFLILEAVIQERIAVLVVVLIVLEIVWTMILGCS